MVFRVVILHSPGTRGRPIRQYYCISDFLLQPNLYLNYMFRMIEKMT